MKPILTLVVACIFFLSVHGATFYETTLHALGAEDFVVQGPAQTGCADTNFSLPSPGEAGISPIFSFNITAGPVRDGDARITAYVNEHEIAFFAPQNMACTDSSCWKRVAISRELILSGENTLRTCLQTSATITKLTRSAQSSIGLYRTPVLSIETIPETRTSIYGETVNLQVIVRNTGSEAAPLHFQRAREVAADKNIYRVVHGLTKWDGILEPGQSHTIAYAIKPKITGTFSIPPAILEYTNIFGEADTLFAKPVLLTVLPVELPIDARLLKQAEKIQAHTPATITVVLKNKTDSLLPDLVVSVQSLSSQPDALLLGNEQHVSLNPQETKAIPLTIQATAVGAFPISCAVTAKEFDTSPVYCSVQTIVAEQPETPVVLIGGILFIALGLGAFLFIQHSK